MQVRIKIFSTHISSQGLTEYIKNSHKAVREGQAAQTGHPNRLYAYGKALNFTHHQGDTH